MYKKRVKITARAASQACPQRWPKWSKWRARSSRDQPTIIFGQLPCMHANDAPLMEKMRSFATQHRIDFTHSEWDLFRKMRVKRNDIIHGKREIDLSDEEIEKLRGMIERILIGKTNETVKALVQS